MPAMAARLILLLLIQLLPIYVKAARPTSDSAQDSQAPSVTKPESVEGSNTPAKPPTTPEDEEPLFIPAPVQAAVQPAGPIVRQAPNKSAATATPGALLQSSSASRVVKQHTLKHRGDSPNDQVQRQGNQHEDEFNDEWGNDSEVDSNPEDKTGSSQGKTTGFPQDDEVDMDQHAATSGQQTAAHNDESSGFLGEDKEAANGAKELANANGVSQSEFLAESREDNGATGNAPAGNQEVSQTEFLAESQEDGNDTGKQNPSNEDEHSSNFLGGSQEDDAEKKPEPVDMRPWHVKPGAKQIFASDVPSSDEIKRNDVFSDAKRASDALKKTSADVVGWVGRVDHRVENLYAAEEVYNKKVEKLRDEAKFINRRAHDMHSEVLTELQSREDARLCAFKNAERLVKGEKPLPCSTSDSADGEAGEA